MPRTCSRLFPFRLSYRYSAYISRVSLVCYMPSPSHPPRSRHLYHLSRRVHEDFHNSFPPPTLLFFPPTLIQTLFPIFRSRKPSDYVIPMMKETKFHTHTKQQEKNFTFSEPCIVIHKSEKDQQDAHFFSIIYFT